MNFSGLMSSNLLYPLNPDRNLPWNDLPELPLDEQIFEDLNL
jgi:hypothetical protein